VRRVPVPLLWDSGRDEVGAGAGDLLRPRHVHVEAAHVVVVVEVGECGWRDFRVLLLVVELEDVDAVSGCPVRGAEDGRLVAVGYGEAQAGVVAVADGDAVGVAALGVELIDELFGLGSPHGRRRIPTGAPLEGMR